MLRNYFKTAWRTIVKSKGYTTLNITGLATGLAVALLIGLWVYNEYSFDRFLPDTGRLYRVQRNFNSNGDTLTFPTTSLKLADVLKKDVPQIEYAAESDWMGSHGLIAGDKKLYVTGGQVGTDFLQMFQFPLLQGNLNNVFSDAYSIVITESLAKALFGSQNAMNKTIRFDNDANLKVTGVLKEVPANSSFQFHFLVPFTYMEQTNTYLKNGGHQSFGNNSFQLFVKLKKGVSLDHAAARVRNIEHTETGNTNAMGSQVILQPMQRWHLYSNYVNGKEEAGFLEYVKMFAVIGALVLLIACINFINLTTARSEKRAREVGVRKAVGSQRLDLVIQFLSESFLLTVISFLFSLLFVWLVLPPFNALTGSSISIPCASLRFWSLIAGCIIVTALTAGSRPAFYLSSFNPVHVLKGGALAGKDAALPRKMLVVLQFSCSVALIISTIIVYQQIQHAKDRPLGYNVNRLLVTEMNDDLVRNYTVLKNELLQNGIAETVTAASSPATNIYWHSDVDNWPGKKAGETIEMGTIVVGEDYFKTLGITMLQGRDFTGNKDTTSVIFNEAAIKQMRIKDPVNQIITWNETKYHIAGVAKDALMVSPFVPADPTMFISNRGNPETNLMYRLSPGIKPQDALKKLTAIFNKYAPAYPYDYKFADTEYAKKFNLEVLIGKLAALFAALAIFISCLGLFGLAAHTAERRTKEIGIRKVLGATVSQVWVLLSKDFILLVIISCVIATPVALYFLHGWLDKYPYRITIGAGVFILAAIVALAITLITVSFQAIKAAIANPVKSLRTE